jgi:hypothetical protein
MAMQRLLPVTSSADGRQHPTSRTRRAARTGCVGLAVVSFDLIAATAWHETVGHGLTAVAFGARITYIDVAGFRCYPEFRWIGPPRSGHFGECGHSPIDDPRADGLIRLAGSLSTWVIAVIATILLCRGGFHDWTWVLMCALSMWWVDLFLYTVPSFGLRRYILWGPSYSEPYEAALAIGVPGPVFQGLVMATSVILAVAIVRQIVPAIRGAMIRPS